MSETFPNGYAVVIGVDDNEVKRLALPAVAKDVTAVHEVLIHPERCAYLPENVKLLKGSDSTKNNILEAFFWLKDKVKADPNATAVIYYSGHGMRDKKTERYYLIPYDIGELSRVRIKAILAEEIQEAISNVRAKRTLVILDCCHARGLDIKDVDPDEPEMDVVAFPDLPETKDVPTYEDGSKDVKLLSTGEGRAILNSSTGAESSYVRSDQKMSVFTYHLIEALTGHAPHADDDQVVFVTDVMSWVTRQVSKTVAAMKRSQTPVMRTDGVFPVAQLLGGEGVALSKGISAPDPLEPLPDVGTTTTVTFNQEGQTVGGHQANIGVMEGNIDFGNKIDTGGGDYAEGDINKSEGGVHISGGEANFNAPVAGGNMEIGSLVQGDSIEKQEIIHGDQVAGDKIDGDKINIGGISGGVVAVGREARAEGTIYQGGQEAAPNLNVAKVFGPLYRALAIEAPGQIENAMALKDELERGRAADDDKIADYIFEITSAAPSSKDALAAIFANPEVAAIVQGMGSTKYALRKLK